MAVCTAQNDRDRFFEHYDTSTGRPITEPLDSMHKVQAWRPGQDCGSVATIPMRASHRRDDRMRTLVCHDMDGGYLEDRFIQGVSRDDCYRFYYWSMIDVFVYFSHHFVTIPPPTWINSAHTNGVPVLGTVITEWNDGKIICEEFLRCAENRKIFVTKLVAISAFYQFEGWLINIENEIPVEDIPNLVAFVQELTDAMHKAVPGSLVIWYDSVIMTGSLDWQNELNANNKPFFDVSDGIFLNYVWKDENLSRSVVAADSRIEDVYVGIDVFGRGCKGGGGFNTIEALTDVRSNNLSAALFAPGWVYEKQGKEDFIANERRFWALLEANCERHQATKLPLTTTFCQGWGMRHYIAGVVTGTKPWTNMSLQAYQAFGPQDGIAYDPTTSYCGGGCIKIDPTKIPTCHTSTLFLTDIKLHDDSVYYVSYTFLGVAPSQLSLQLASSPLTPTAKASTFLLVDASVSRTDMLQSSQLHGAIICTNFEEETQAKRSVYLSNANRAGWTTRWFRIQPTAETRINSVALVWEENLDKLIHLGGFRFLTADDMESAEPEVRNLRATEVISRQATEAGTPVIEADLTLLWDCSAHVDYFAVYQSVGEGMVFIGATTTTAYRISKMEYKVSLAKFKVQAIFNGGTHTVLDDAPSTTVFFV